MYSTLLTGNAFIAPYTIIIIRTKASVRILMYVLRIDFLKEGDFFISLTLSL